MIVGIDEVGRGCWAGPVVAGAVLLECPIIGLKDSKKLTKLKREILAKKIASSGAATGIGWVWPNEVDQIGLTAAVRLAMQRALDQICEHFDKIIIDGNYNFLSHDIRAETLICADDTVPEVSAASIIAKVARDSYMSGIAQDYPNYGFESHVGYGTSLHRSALELYGVTALHRLSVKPVKALLQ